MKKLIAYLLACFIFIVFSGSTDIYAAEREVTIILNGSKVSFSDTEPVLTSGRVLVPVRGFFEKIGVTVDWNQKDRIAIIKDDRREIMLELGNRTALNNGVAQYLDCSVILKDGHAMIPLRYIAESFGYKVEWDQSSLTVHINKDLNRAVDSAGLPVLNDLETLYQLIRYSNTMRDYLNYDAVIKKSDSVQSMEAARSSNKVSEAVGADSAASGDYSGTNNQVEGVEEGDLVKTDGKLIYSAGKDKVRIVNAAPADLRILSTIPCNNGISEIYAYGNKLIVINGNSHMRITTPDNKYRDLTEEIFGAEQLTSTNVRIFNISDPKKPKLLQDMDYEGSYVSSRMVDDNLYIVTNANIYFFSNYIDDEFTELFCRNDKAGFKRLLDEDIAERDALFKQTGCKTADELFASVRAILEYSVTPGYTDNRTGTANKLKLKDIPYFPDMIRPNYLMTVGIDLNGGKSEVKAYMGCSQELYASADHLYAAIPDYEYNTIRSKLRGYPCYDYNTSVYRFGLQNGRVSYEAKGGVPGGILDQFSMDEYKGIFRIATTTGQSEGSSQNNVYALDEKLGIKGRLEGIAEGERIYSTRFAGDRIYMVTFRNMDPFFVIDAANPGKMSVLGYLKIPGYSTYMHILDNDHVLGFGYDANETRNSGVQKGGFKLSLFDVSNVSKPKEIKNETIGIKAYSSLENDHKALMISLEKGVMGFPVVNTYPDEDFFAGYYVYNISRDDFSMRGFITHLPENVSAGNAKEKQFINRGIYIGDYLYTFSQDRMEVHGLKTLKKVGSLQF